MTSLTEGAISREVLAAPDGKSGNVVERVTLAGGRALIVKRLSRGGDWLARATLDDGRIALLWDSGYLERMPTVVHHAVVSVETETNGWLVVMEDVSRALIPEQTLVSRDANRRVMAAMRAMSEEFWGEHVDGLCSLETRYAFLSPATAAREADGDNPVPKLIGRGWDVFAEVVPADVAVAVLAILELGLLGGLVQLGWDKALAVTERDKEAAAKEREDLDWWVARARAALEKWSPV